MSDSEDSTVTYTAVSSPFGGMSDIGSPRVDGPPVMLEDPYAYVVAVFQAPPSPDYMPGPEEPKQALLSLEFVPEPVYLEFMPPEDEVLSAEEQPLPAAVSPTADSPRYIPKFNLEEDPTVYPADEGDDHDDDDESSDDDEDDDEDVKEVEDEDEEEEEEHPALVESVPPPVYRVTARMSIRDEPPIPFWSEVEVARLLSIPSPPPSALYPWSSPLPQIPSPPLPVSSLVPVSPLPLPASPTYPLGYRAAMIWASVAMMRVAALSTYILASQSEIPPLGTPPLLHILAPTSSPPLLLPSTDHRADRRKVCLPPWKRLCIAFGPRYEVRESSSAFATRLTGCFRADYGFVATLDREIRQDTDEIYGRLDEAQEARAVLSGQLNLLGRDSESTEDYCIGTTSRDCSLASSRPRLTDTTYGDTETDEYTADTCDSTAGTAGTH
ncbi:hypothetical protein Tco_1218090 [Tanacetum coccineum]